MYSPIYILVIYIMYEIMKVNGYCILLNKLPNSKTCRVTAYIGDGFMNETEKTSGMSHLTEHILGEAWQKCVKKGCSTFWKDFGVLTNAETENNMVTYWIEGLSEFGIKMLDYITSIVTNPIITKKRLKKEKEAVTHELQHLNYQETRLYNHCNQILYTNKGLQNSENIKLQIKNLDEFTLGNVLDWLKKTYCQNNTVFAIVGDFNKKQVMKKLNQNLYRSKFTTQCIPKNYDFFQKGMTISHVRERKKENTSIVFLFPQYINTPNKTCIYVDFFSLFIGNGVESFLMQELREKKDLIYNTNVSSTIYPRSSVLRIELATTNNHIKKVILETIKVLNSIIKGKFSRENMNDIKRKFMVNYYQRCLNNDFYTHFYGSQLMNQLETLNSKTKIYTYEEVANLITKITKREFVEFVSKIINFADMKIVYQGERKTNLDKKDINKLVN
jgi:predicted Zn-dependent peptidase